MKYFTRSFFLPLMTVGEIATWVFLDGGKGGLFLNVALFLGPQYSEQNQSMANNEKTFMW